MSGPTAEGDVSDIFDLQDKVTEASSALSSRGIRLEEIKQARMKPTDYISAYSLRFARCRASTA